MTILKPTTLSNAPEASRPILEGTQKALGFIPNLFATMSHNPELLKTYTQVSESYAKSGLSALEQQVVALSVSRENSCHYCMAAHSALSKMAYLDERIIAQIRAGETLEDTKLETLSRFTKRLVASRGWADPADLEQFFKAGYTESHVLAVILGITLKTISNYTNHLAQTPLDDAFKPFEWKR